MSSSDSAELTPQHHRAVADLEPADRGDWLEAARRSGWTASDLRQALREAANLARPNRERQLEKIRRATARRKEARKEADRRLRKADRDWRAAIRAAKDLKLREAAEAAGVSHTHVRRIREGTDQLGKGSG